MTMRRANELVTRNSCTDRHRGVTRKLIFLGALLIGFVVVSLYAATAGHNASTKATEVNGRLEAQAARMEEFKERVVFEFEDMGKRQDQIYRVLLRIEKNGYQVGD